jgi:hypothetical protein
MVRELVPDLRRRLAALPRRFAFMAAVSVLLAAPALIGTRTARAAACALPQGAPFWADYNDYTFLGWHQFAQPAVTAATSDQGLAEQLRRAGANTIYWDMYLRARVGTPSTPADPSTLAAMAARVDHAAVAVTGCANPYVAENELFGAQTAGPWSPSTSAYRANVLTYVRDLAALGARPFLLISRPPATDSTAAGWWHSLAGSADVVQEVFVPARALGAEGPIIASRSLREQARADIARLRQVGVPASRLGLMGEFESAPGEGGRSGLAPAQAWFELVKLEALAFADVAREQAIGSIWSWGWGAFSAAERDPAKPAAACVWLWARDPGLCGGIAAAGAGFDGSLSEGQLASIPADAQCTIGAATIPQTELAGLAALRGQFAAEQQLLERLAITELLPQGPDPAPPERVNAALAEVLADRFRNQPDWLIGALGSRGVTPSEAQPLLADELRLRALAAAQAVSRPGVGAIAGFEQRNRRLLALLVTLRPLQGAAAPGWLGYRLHGYALTSTAPGRLFRMSPGHGRNLDFLDGSYRVTIDGQAHPIAALTRKARRLLAASVAASIRTREAEALIRTKLAATERRLLAQTICRGDALPPADGTDLLSSLPFLTLPQ